MKIGKSIERSLKWLYLAPATLVRHGTLRPKRVKLWDCENWIHIDPDDRRSIKKFVHDQIRKRTSTPLRFWRDFLVKIQPDIAIDVGVNYGECLFGTTYASHTRAYGFEANPRLAPYLRKSRESHRDTDQMTIVDGLVSDRIEEGIPFYSDPSWSGTGSAVASLNEGPEVIKSEIKARTIDSIIPRNDATGARLLFKMDIEGYESRAFGGFWETIEAVQLAVGFIEFDTTYIREAGEDPQAYFAKLTQRFDIHCLSDGKAGSITKVDSFNEMPISRAADQRIHTDLLLVTRGVDTNIWLPEHWSIAERSSG